MYRLNRRRSIVLETQLDYLCLSTDVTLITIRHPLRNSRPSRSTRKRRRSVKAPTPHIPLHPFPAERRPDATFVLILTHVNWQYELPEAEACPPGLWALPGAQEKMRRG